jgi:heme-degrading monooxygenase HmoA
MVVRSWRCYAPASNTEACPKHLLETVQPTPEALVGFRGVYLRTRREADEVEFLVLTLWDSMDAIHKFAGVEPNRAVVEPEAQAGLLRFDAEAEHYQALASPDMGGQRQRPER